MTSIQYSDLEKSIEMKDRVQLIAYVDRFGDGDLSSLGELLTGPLQGLFGCVHLLPFFYPIDGADTGFDPIDHTVVDGRLGEWDDIRTIAAHTDVMADLIVNHISTASREFRDYLEKGEESGFAELFVSFGDIFPDGAMETEILEIYRPRPLLPFSPKTLRDKSKRLFWTTFTPEQVDINIQSDAGRRYLSNIMETFPSNGIRALRLDAVGYTVKQRGTSCFMLPRTMDLIGELVDEAKSHGMEVLVEVHSHYSTQIELARYVDWVYDFALPPLILHTLFSGNAKAIKRWFSICPHNCISVLDTHDGIGVIDVAAATGEPDQAGLLSTAELEELVETIHRNSRGVSREATGDGKSNLDSYQVNCTYYDALGRKDDDYLLARLIQLIGPGIPQIYYVGLMAGENDVMAFRKTGSGREVNRGRYALPAICRQVEKPVVAALLGMIRFRNAHPAFGGRFSVEGSCDRELVLRREKTQHWIELRVDVATRKFLLAFSLHEKSIEIDSFNEFLDATRVAQWCIR